MYHLPRLLQQTIARAQRRLTEDGDIAIDDLMEIGLLFGDLNDSPSNYQPYHSRRFLLVLLSLRTLVPCWVYLRPNDTLFLHHLKRLSHLVVQPMLDNGQQIVFEEVWDWVDQSQLNTPFCDTVQLSVSTLLKGLSAFVEPYEEYGYKPNTHVDVALNLVGQAYSAFPHKRMYRKACTFWQYWLVHIVPVAWFSLSSDSYNNNL